MMRPKVNNKTDRRCGLIDNYKNRDHKLCDDPDDNWCFGCHFYICEECDESPMMGNHDIMEHSLQEFDTEEDEW